MEWTPVQAISVSIVVVTAPAWTEGCVDFEHRVYDPKGVLDQWVSGAADTISNQLKESGVDDILSRKISL